MPPIAAVDTNLVIIWFLAVGTIVIGAYWSGVIANEQRCVTTCRHSVSARLSSFSHSPSKSIMLLLSKCTMGF